VACDRIEIITGTGRRKKDAIVSTPEQEKRICAPHARMEGEAKTLGTRLVVAEADLNQTFVAGRMTPEPLRTTLAEIAEVESDLRFRPPDHPPRNAGRPHPDQILTYSRLRGIWSIHVPHRHRTMTQTCGGATTGAADQL
jgi:hypothetical protein